MYALNLIDTPGHVDFSYEVRAGIWGGGSCWHMCVCVWWWGGEGGGAAAGAGGTHPTPPADSEHADSNTPAARRPPAQVSRSLAACEGCLLVVDASQGVEAQTLANVYLALENDLEIIPVLNKIDLPGAEPDRVKREIEEVVGLDCSNAIMASAKQVGRPCGRAACSVCWGRLVVRGVAAALAPRGMTEKERLPGTWARELREREKE